MIEDWKHDSTRVLIAGLPVKFDSTDVLLVPVGWSMKHERYSDKYMSRDYRDPFVSESQQDHLTGNFANLVFRDHQGHDHKLTDQVMDIQQVVFLRKIKEATGHAYLLYHIADQDTNDDQQIDQRDRPALYISNYDGTAFKRITARTHHLNDYVLRSDERRLYFITTNDANDNGYLNDGEEQHHYYVEFGADGYTVHEHSPLQVFK